MSAFLMNFSNNSREFQMIEFDNGYYQGEVMNNKREGFGVFYWDSGQIYLGKWCKDYMEDEGVVYFSEGGCAYGNFRRNKLCGYSCVLDPHDNMLVGHFTKGILESGVWNDKTSGKWYRYDVQNSEPNKDYELITKSEVPQIVTLKEVIKRIFHECQGRKCIKYIEYTDATFFVGVSNENGKTPAGLGVFHDADSKVLQVGYHKGKKLNGFGRQYLGFMINDGIFELQDFKYGTQFFIRDKKYFYGFFNGNQIKKIVKSGVGYPSYLLGYYKHPSKYANAKIDKVQDLELMQDLQNQFLHRYQQFGYSEIYKSSPKKKNMLLFVENKFSEDFISPHCSVYQEVLETTQYARSQNQNSSHSPMRKQVLQLYDDEDIPQSKQTTTKISPSSQSSYTPSNLRLQQHQQNLENSLIKSKDFFNNSTDKKKSKSSDSKQNAFLSTQKKQKMNNSRQLQDSLKQDSQNIFIIDGYLSSADSNEGNYSSQQQLTNSQQKQNSAKEQNPLILALQQPDTSKQQKQSVQFDNNSIYPIQEEESNSGNFQNESDLTIQQNGEGQQMNIPEIAQNAINQFKNSITSSMDKNSKKSMNKNSLSSSSQQQSISESIQLAEEQYKHFQQTNSIQTNEFQANQPYYQREENDKSSKREPNNQQQLQKLEQSNHHVDISQLDDELKQIQQLQELLQTFNGANQQNLNRKIKEQPNVLENNRQDNQLDAQQSYLQNSELQNTFSNQQNRNSSQLGQRNYADLRTSPIGNQNISSHYSQDDSQYKNENSSVISGSLLVRNIQDRIIQQYQEQLSELPNTLAPDTKVESSSRQISSERLIDESSQNNDRRKHETPRFDLLTQNKKITQLDSTYKNASQEVSSLFNEVQNQMEDIRRKSIEEQHLENMMRINEDISQEQNDSIYNNNSNNNLQNERQKSISINSQKQQTQQNQINDRSSSRNDQRDSIYSVGKQSIDYKINNPQNESTENIEDIQEDIIEQIKRMRKNTEESRNRSRLDSQAQSQQLQSQYQSVNSQKQQQQQMQEYPESEISKQQQLQQYQIRINEITEDHLPQAEFQAEQSLRNSFDGRDRLESLQLPKTPSNVIQQSPQGYIYQEKKANSNGNEFEMDSKHENIYLDGIKCDDSIHHSEQQNLQIVQKLNTFNKDKIKREQNDSFECNIFQESQSQQDFIDSQGRDVKNEEYYKSLMQTIPENKEQDSGKNSSTAEQNQQSNQIDSRYQSVTSNSDNLASFQAQQNYHSVQKQNLQANQASQLDSIKQSYASRFQSMNKNLNELRLMDDQNTTLDDDNEEGKTKFKYINQSPSKPLLSKSTIHFRQRKKIFDSSLNNSFTTVSPSMSKQGLSPISQHQQQNHFNVIIPSNNNQKISEFNINNFMSTQSQNKQEYTLQDLNEINQFKKEKNRLNTTNSFDQMSFSEKQLIFNNPQMQEYSTQNTNNFSSNATQMKYKQYSSNQQQQQHYNQQPQQMYWQQSKQYLHNQNNNPYNSNTQYQQQNNNSNSNLTQFYSNASQFNNQHQMQQQPSNKSINHFRVQSQHEPNMYHTNSNSSIDGFQNKLQILPNNSNSSFKFIQETSFPASTSSNVSKNYPHKYDSIKQQQGVSYHSRQQSDIQFNKDYDSRLGQSNNENQIFYKFQNEDRKSIVSDKIVAQQLQPSYNSSKSRINPQQLQSNYSSSNQKQTLTPDAKSLRQIMNTSFDKKQLTPTSTSKGFFYENGLQKNKANFFTNSGCEPVLSFKQENDSKDQYNSLKCQFSRQLQQSLNELNEQNSSFASVSHQPNNNNNSISNKMNSQNDLNNQDEENNSFYIKNSNVYESNKKQSTQFYPVMNSQLQTKENNTLNPLFSHKQRPNKFKFNINLTDISNNNDKLTPEKQFSQQQSLTPSSKKTISVSNIQRMNEQNRKNDGILDQFLSVKSNLKNQFQSTLKQSPYQQQHQHQQQQQQQSQKQQQQQYFTSNQNKFK